MIKEVGNTLLFLFLVLIFILGAKMALRVSVPFIRPLSASLAAAIESV